MAHPEEIFPGLYQISGGVNAFLIDDPEDGVILIDAGLPFWRDTILDALRALDKTPPDLNHVLVTHADLDHIGSLGPVAQSGGAEIYASQASSEYIHSRTAPPHLPIYLKPFVWFANRFLIKTSFVHNIVADGDTLPLAGGIQVLAAPGHTPDNHVYFWKREKVLFAADLLNTQRDDTLDLTLPRLTWDMDKAKASARRVLDLQPRYICVGHGPVVNVEAQPEQVEQLRARL